MNRLEHWLNSMNKEITKVLEEVKENFSKEKNNYEKGGFYIYRNKHIEFYGAPKEQILSMHELTPLFNFMKKYNYTSNLD